MFYLLSDATAFEKSFSKFVTFALHGVFLDEFSGCFPENSSREFTNLIFDWLLGTSFLRRIEENRLPGMFFTQKAKWDFCVTGCYRLFTACPNKQWEYFYMYSTLILHCLL